MKTISAHHIFKIFADPARLRILNILIHGERCVCDIMSALKMGQSKVSRHLGTLKQAGLVRARRDGFWMHYSLVKPSGSLQKRLFECLDSCVGEDALFKKDVQALRKTTAANQRKLNRAICS